MPASRLRRKRAATGKCESGVGMGSRRAGARPRSGRWACSRRAIGRASGSPTGRTSTPTRPSTPRFEGATRTPPRGSRRRYPARCCARLSRRSKPIKRATAYICGLGFHELRINGKKVGDTVLDPAFTRYDKRAALRHARRHEAGQAGRERDRRDARQRLV